MAYSLNYFSRLVQSFSTRDLHLQGLSRLLSALLPHIGVEVASGITTVVVEDQGEDATTATVETVLATDPAMGSPETAGGAFLEYFLFSTQSCAKKIKNLRTRI